MLCVRLLSELMILFLLRDKQSDLLQQVTIAYELQFDLKIQNDAHTQKFKALKSYFNTFHPVDSFFLICNFLFNKVFLIHLMNKGIVSLAVPLVSV